MLAVRLPEALEKRLTSLAKSQERSKSYYIKKALEKFLEEEEEKQEALQAYEAFVKSGEKIFSFEEVMKRNGL